MLTPVFELNEDDDFVVVIIKTPYVKVSLNFFIKKVVSCIGVKRRVLFLFNFFLIRIFFMPFSVQRKSCPIARDKWILQLG